MDILKVCHHCGGKGFTRRNPDKLHPFTNVAHATSVYADGSKEPTVCRTKWLEPVKYLEFPCLTCEGLGEFLWTRGKSLTPILPAKGA